MRRLRVLLLAALAAATGGCATLGYYAQSVAGHLSLMAGREPISELLSDPDTPPELRSRLAGVLRIRDFASRSLHLPDNGSYRSYVHVGRRYVVWTVVATPEFSLAPLQWCFPVAGCVSYRGYYSEEGARAFAAGLRRRGFDVAVNGAAAYSTLGWFDDPVPDTILDRPEYLVAALIFHELAHQRLYVEDDSAFNEAFATTVEREGVHRWLRRGGRTEMQADYARLLAREQAFVGLVLDARERLEALYAGEAGEAGVRAHKARILEGLRARYRAVRAGWQGGPTFDAWFAGDLNNAKIASVATYEDLVPGFEALLAREGGDLEAFYEACARLGRLGYAQRRERLGALARRGAPQAGGRRRAGAAARMAPRSSISG